MSLRIIRALLDYPGWGVSKEKVKERIEAIGHIRFRATERERVVYALSALWGLDEDEVDGRIHKALERRSASMLDAVGLHLSDCEMQFICDEYREIWVRLEHHLSQKGYF